MQSLSLLSNETRRPLIGYRVISIRETMKQQLRIHPCNLFLPSSWWTCMYPAAFEAFCCDVAVLLCRAVPQVQPVLQSLRRPCSRLPRPDAACSAFSTSPATRGPTPQQLLQRLTQTHAYVHVHTLTGASFHSGHKRSAKGRRPSHHRFCLLCSALPLLSLLFCFTCFSFSVSFIS